MAKCDLPPPRPIEQQLEAAQLPPADPEFAFAPGRKWAFDFAWPPWKIALEIEGGTWVRGRHNSPLGYEEDCRKYNRAAVLGWLVIRATPAMVRRGQVLGELRAAFAARGLE
jgi:hypothetical protein